MRIAFKQLKKMKVETLSGTNLGKVHDIIFDTEGQNIIQYIVKLGTLATEENLISRDQIVRFEDKKVIVYDTAVKKKDRDMEKIIPLVPQVDSNLAMRQE